ncbi:MAG: LVIVD repeat-containing protein [Bacteroidota bacterium]
MNSLKNSNQTYIAGFINTVVLLASLFVLSACEGLSSDISNETGTGGSTARFTIVGEHLYTVDFQNLHTFAISNPNDIQYHEYINTGFGIETIFPYGDKLFLVARDGMYIYDISSPDEPELIGTTYHFYSRDPVVVQDDIAYVTLNSWNSELQIYDVSNLTNPILLESYSMESPFGLAIRDNILFVCDRGIKIFDVENVNQVRLLHHYTNIDARDLILDEDRIIVTGPGGINQYRINQNSSLTKISSITTFASVN